IPALGRISVSSRPAWSTESGLNIYIKRMFDSCWLLKGTCRESCQPREIFNIFCGTQYLCCIDPEDMPTLFVK
uniref:Beta-defensin n=1 Tax=Cricetulus griseus TaxID=10029 RepID=A0A8C2MWN1_CRIGR